jgi:hypothetical protein
MEPIVSIQAALLRTQMSDLVLRPGASVVARVASRGEAHGVLMVAGIPLTAQLPRGVEAGDTLKLRVEEVTQDRVVLRLDQQAPVAAPVAAPPQPQPARVTVQEPPRRRHEDDGGTSVALTFESPSLGRIDLRIDLATSALHIGVAALPGRPYEAASGGSERLRATLDAATGLRSTVRVTRRHEPLDIYA